MRAEKAGDLLRPNAEATVAKGEDEEAYFAKAWLARSFDDAAYVAGSTNENACPAGDRVS